jgi:hypothetical protein
MSTYRMQVCVLVAIVAVGAGIVAFSRGDVVVGVLLAAIAGANVWQAINVKRNAEAVQDADDVDE